MSEYETIYILKPDLPPARTEKISEKIQKILNESKAQVLNQKDWGKRKLAFPIGSFTYGHYVYFNYSGNGSFITDLERTLKYEEEVIRYLTIKIASEEKAKQKDKVKKVTDLEEFTLSSFEPRHYDDDYGDR